MSLSDLVTHNPPHQIGYCTNVHAGVDLASIRKNLIDYAVPVADQLRREQGVDELGIGLWIPDQASREIADGEVDAFRDFLESKRLVPFTINGFPFANFHGDSVKQRVYLPTWADRERLDYTKRLAKILAALLPEGRQLGSISTLPIDWPGNPFSSSRQSSDSRGGDEGQMAAAGRNLRELAAYLANLYKETGKTILVAIEPEPGCRIDTAEDMIDFFDGELSGEVDRSYITVCHDICHSAVMNEPQRDAIKDYSKAGLTIGKVQVSNAIVADWRRITAEQRRETLEQLSGFAEDRYLHQTGQVYCDGDFRLAEDLPGLIAETAPEDLAELERWVIHFHVPIFLEQFGHLTTSRDDVLTCLDAIADPEIGVEFSGHLEVETYAWTVMPESMRNNGLAEDIASELIWLMKQLQG